jgi:altronate dehydratase small subunit
MLFIMETVSEQDAVQWEKTVDSIETDCYFGFNGNLISVAGGVKMAGSIQAGADALVMEITDHVATAIREIAAGETVKYAVKGKMETVQAVDPIPFGHKIAIADIPQGAQVRKYGEVIGQATQPIAKGQHVHVHNLEGIRGRGDKAKGAEAK